jgi:hypothetical protein
MMEREQIEQMQQACARLAHEAADTTAAGPAADALRELIGQIPDLTAGCLQWVDALQMAGERIPRLRARCRRLTAILEQVRQRLEDYADDPSVEVGETAPEGTVSGSSGEATEMDLSEGIEGLMDVDGDDGPAKTDGEMVESDEAIAGDQDDSSSDALRDEEEEPRSSVVVRGVGERSKSLDLDEVLPADALLAELEAIDGELSHRARTTSRALGEIMDLADLGDDASILPPMSGHARPLDVTSSTAGGMQSGSGISYISRILDELHGVAHRSSAAAGGSLPDFDEWLEELDRIEMDLLGD